MKIFLVILIYCKVLISSSFDLEFQFVFRLYEYGKSSMAVGTIDVLILLFRNLSKTYSSIGIPNMAYGTILKSDNVFLKQDCGLKFTNPHLFYRLQSLFFLIDCACLSSVIFCLTVETPSFVACWAWE
jgi:hypothetical protein